MDVGGESRSLNESVPGTSDVEETEGREGRNVVTAEIEVIVPLLDLGGANRSRREMPKVPEKAEIQGWSRRKLPRQERLRLRNSSGSVTA